MKGFVGRLKKELAPGRREAVIVNQLRKVDILKERVEGELQSILEYFEDTDADRLCVLEEGKVFISSRKDGQLCIHCFQHSKKL